MVGVTRRLISARPSRPRRKRPDRYHHGDLRRALIEQAVRTIQAGGVETLTLRDVGRKLGVSRTALYRHYADKAALLAAVAAQGFRLLASELRHAWERGGGGREGFGEMGVAYVRFAIENSSHYRVMFGGFVDAAAVADPELVEARTAAFQLLVDALISQQQEGLVRRDDPLQLARFIWAIVHGITMLVIDGRLGPSVNPEQLTRYAIDRARTGITV
jgi:AcrR family transcriptional regulator